MQDGQQSPNDMDLDTPISTILTREHAETAVDDDEDTEVEATQVVEEAQVVETKVEAEDESQIEVGSQSTLPDGGQTGHFADSDVTETWDHVTELTEMSCVLEDIGIVLAGWLTFLQAARIKYAEKCQHDLAEYGAQLQYVASKVSFAVGKFRKGEDDIVPRLKSIHDEAKEFVEKWPALKANARPFLPECPRSNSEVLLAGHRMTHDEFELETPKKKPRRL